MNFPTPAILAIYKISLFKADDAALILRKTNKTPRLPPDRAALALNSAIRRCLREIGQASASPASEHAAWATQLAEALERGLSLLAPGSTHAPLNSNSNLVNAFARLFNAGIPAEVEELLKRHGFTSPMQALELGTIGLWFIHAFAVQSAAEWRKNVRPADEMGRRGPEAALLIWVQVMGDLYGALVDAAPPSSPTADSPFIRFCGEISAIMLARVSPTSTEISLRLFLEMLRGAKASKLAAFMCRNKGAWAWGASPTKQAATAS